MPKHNHYDEADLSAVNQTAANNSQSFNQDEGIFTAKQLDHVKAKVYERKTPEMLGLKVIPMSTDTPEYAETITYKTYDQVGMAKIIANYADDLPRADVAGTEHTVRVRDVGDSYGYSINELNASAKLGTQLPQKKANAARRAIEVKLNQIAMVGDAKYGLHGLTNHPNIGVTVLSGGDWTAALTTAEKILADLDALWSSVRISTKGVHTPNRLLLSSVLHAAATSKRLADSGGKTAMEFFLSKHTGLQVVEAPEFDGAGTSNKNLIFIGEFDETNISHEMVMPFNQLPAQARNLELVVPCRARTAGVVVNYPLAFSKAEI